MKLDRDDLSKIPKALRRMIEKQATEAIELLGHRRRLIDADVHAARKLFKQIRAAMRVLRDLVGARAFAKENAAYRDAGRALSAVRDAKVMIDTLDDLAEHFSNPIERRAAQPLRRALQSRQREIRAQVLQQSHAARDALAQIESSRRRISKWKIPRCGWRAFGAPLQATYRKARRALREAQRSTDHDEFWHEARKRAKDLRYQLEMLEKLWPRLIGPIARRARRLADVLGREHDLAVLCSIATGELAGKLSSVDGELVSALIQERRRRLRAQAGRIGTQLYADKPARFVRRIHQCWKATKTNAFALAESN